MNIISIRLNNEEMSNLNMLLRKHGVNSRSGFIKQLVFNEIKPYLDKRERELLGAYIVELNAIGRSLNQLLKYRAFEDGILLSEDIKEIINGIKETL